jgi:hypothetical protein
MFKFLSAFLFSAALASGAWACSCRPPAPGEDQAAFAKRMIRESTAAFSGRVLSSIKTDADINRGEVIARVRIVKAYKGVRRGRIITLKTGPNPAMCGLTLEKGSTVRVAADKSRDGTYSAGSCSQF